MEQKMAEKNLLIAVRKSRCDLKPLKRQIESQEYLVHKRKITEAFLTMIGSVYIPKTYQEIIQELEAQIELILKEINIIKTKSIYNLIERLDSKNVIGPKWIFTLKFNIEGLISNQKTCIIIQ